MLSSTPLPVDGMRQFLGFPAFDITSMLMSSGTTG
jgi:hypothetical protein